MTDYPFEEFITQEQLKELEKLKKELENADGKSKGKSSKAVQTSTEWSDGAV